MGKCKQCRPPAGGATKFTRRSLAAALPAPAFFITALLLFFFMSLPVSGNGTFAITISRAKAFQRAP